MGQEDQSQQEGEIKTPHHPDEIKEKKLLKDTFEVTEKETTEEFDKEKKIIESFQEQKEIHSEKELLNNDSSNLIRQKKHSKQESVVDSESIPDIETLDGKENIFLTQENKDLLSNDDDLDFDE